MRQKTLFQDKTRVVHNADYCISSHFNAFGAGNTFNTANGHEVLCHSVASKVRDSKLLALSIAKRLTKGNITFRGLHALRHTFASKCFKAKPKIDVKIISEILGHSDIKITQNTYVHLLEEQKIEAIELLDAI